MYRVIQRIGLVAIIIASFMPSAMQADVAPTNLRTSDSTPVAALLPPARATQETMHMKVTAYSSSVDETDNTPFITATGMHVRDGIVATNILPFGTKVTIPALFGDKVFTVEDRMAERMKNVIDIWMPSKSAALRFGVAYTNIVVLTPTDLSLK